MPSCIFTGIAGKRVVCPSVVRKVRGFMCGISGILSESISTERLAQRIAKMCRMQAHRGPDGQDTHIFEQGRIRVALGFVRLAILDLETGMQPIRCPADGSAIICNGQIYNYVELRPRVDTEPFVSKGDVEVALHLYRRKGIDFLQELNGMYAGAILDPVRRRLVLFRDRFGIKPLYYAEAGDGFAFCSEIKPLFHALDLAPGLNTQRLSAYFVYRYVPGEQTLFRGVRRLPPGSFLVYDLETKKFAVHRYWNYVPEEQDFSTGLSGAASAFYELFRDAVRIRLRADVEVGSFISGGIDSSSVAASAMESRTGMRLYTATFDEAKYDELPDVRRFIKHHRRLLSRARLHPAHCGKESLDRLPGIIEAVEEPISLGTMLPTDRVCEAAARDVKAVLTGEGADEIFAGYRKFMLESAACEYYRLGPGMQRRLRERFPELRDYLRARSPDPARRYIQAEALFDASELKRLLGSEPEGPLFPPEAAPPLTGREHPVNAAIAFESRCRLPDYVVLRLDKLAMRHSLETRTPFLDYRLAELAARLPIDMKVNLALDREKLICAYAFVKYGLLDARTAFRKKQPFTFPMADWLADAPSLPEPIREIVLGDEVKRQNVIDPDFVRQIAGNVTAADVGPQTLVSQADRLFSIIVFTLWHRAFIEGFRSDESF